MLTAAVVFMLLATFCHSLEEQKVATKRDVAWIMRDFPAGRTHVYFWRDMNETCTTCMYSVMAIRADSQFRAVGNMVQWFYVPWAQIASAGTHSIKLDATLPFENYILLVTSEATRTCRLYKLFRAGDRPGFMRMGKCPYLGVPGRPGNVVAPTPNQFLSNQIPNSQAIVPVPNTVDDIQKSVVNQYQNALNFVNSQFNTANNPNAIANFNNPNAIPNFNPNPNPNGFVPNFFGPNVNAVNRKRRFMELFLNALDE